MRYSLKDDAVSFDFEDMRNNGATYALSGDTVTITETKGRVPNSVLGTLAQKQGYRDKHFLPISVSSCPY